MLLQKNYLDKQREDLFRYFLPFAGFSLISCCFSWLSRFSHWFSDSCRSLWSTLVTWWRCYAIGGGLMLSRLISGWSLLMFCSGKLSLRSCDKLTCTCLYRVITLTRDAGFCYVYYTKIKTRRNYSYWQMMQTDSQDGWLNLLSNGISS